MRPDPYNCVSSVPISCKRWLLLEDAVVMIRFGGSAQIERVAVGEHRDATAYMEGAGPLFCDKQWRSPR